MLVDPENPLEIPILRVNLDLPEHLGDIGGREMTKTAHPGEHVRQAETQISPVRKISLIEMPDEVALEPLKTTLNLVVAMSGLRTP